MPSNIPLHSWSIKNWPDGVYPGSKERARYVIRRYSDDLTREGALIRVGRELVIIGEGYFKWLKKKRAAVRGYDCPANKGKEAA